MKSLQFMAGFALGFFVVMWVFDRDEVVHNNKTTIQNHYYQQQRFY
jgi:hypothetical protein